MQEKSAIIKKLLSAILLFFSVCQTLHHGILTQKVCANKLFKKINSVILFKLLQLLLKQMSLSINIFGDLCIIAYCFGRKNFVPHRYKKDLKSYTIYETSVNVVIINKLVCSK